MQASSGGRLRVEGAASNLLVKGQIPSSHDASQGGRSTCRGVQLPHCEPLSKCRGGLQVSWEGYYATLVDQVPISSPKPPPKTQPHPVTNEPAAKPELPLTSGGRNRNPAARSSTRSANRSAARSATRSAEPAATAPQLDGGQNLYSQICRLIDSRPEAGGLGPRGVGAAGLVYGVWPLACIVSLSLWWATLGLGFRDFRRGARGLRV